MKWKEQNEKGQYGKELKKVKKKIEKKDFIFNLIAWWSYDIINVVSF